MFVVACGLPGRSLTNTTEREALRSHSLILYNLTSLTNDGERWRDQTKNKNKFKYHIYTDQEYGFHIMKKQLPLQDQTRSSQLFFYFGLARYPHHLQLPELYWPVWGTNNVNDLNSLSLSFVRLNIWLYSRYFIAATTKLSNELSRHVEFLELKKFKVDVHLSFCP